MAKREFQNLYSIAFDMEYRELVNVCKMLFRMGGIATPMERNNHYMITLPYDEKNDKRPYLVSVPAIYPKGEVTVIKVTGIEIGYYPNGRCHIREIVGKQESMDCKIEDLKVRRLKTDMDEIFPTQLSVISHYMIKWYNINTELWNL